MNQALNQLDSLLNSKILFVVDKKDKLLGQLQMVILEEG